MTKGQRIFQAREIRGVAEHLWLLEPTVTLSGFLSTYFPLSHLLARSVKCFLT